MMDSSTNNNSEMGNSSKPTSSRGNGLRRTESVDAAAKKSPFGQMLDNVREECQKLGVWSEQMHRDLPKKWEKHGDLIILPQNSFTLPDWRLIGECFVGGRTTALNFALIDNFGIFRLLQF